MSSHAIKETETSGERCEGKAMSEDKENKTAPARVLNIPDPAHAFTMPSAGIIIRSLQN